ncbi:tRNA adenosine(34) deaminase TadA [uncultured Megasphaera sp.]|uniref:tRNA adenosine(34) deaminase TadA n=1 Tax=uncultured Megasphaera sp. TaxID=165188 RepID=UPI00261D9F27|nr:tRNA adenosine(34) deaminase TadA [uncultured Megasphaera sp.]
MTKDEFYMGKALEEAKTAYAVGEIPIGAVIIYQKKAIARAYNLRESLPCATAHAELLAIEKACRALGRWRLSGCTLYVTCEPCPMCAGAIVNSRLDRVVYGCADPKAGAVRSLFQLADSPLLNHQASITAGVRADECAALLKDFFRKKRKKVILDSPEIIVITDET